jgi:hypothetical protein
MASALWASILPSQVAIKILIHRSRQRKVSHTTDVEYRATICIGWFFADFRLA